MTKPSRVPSCNPRKIWSPPARRSISGSTPPRSDTAAGNRLQSLEEFLLHGVRYAYAPRSGALTRGLPTGHAAPPLNKIIVQPDEPPPVWPYAHGTVRGYSFAPLYPTVPEAALRDPVLYELLALVDAIREGRARERDIAAKELNARLYGAGSASRTGAHPAEASPTLHEPPAGYAPSSASGGAVAQKLRISQTKLAALCRKYGIARLSLFGSASRNELKPGSDVDLMVEFLPDSRASLFDIAQMQDEFSAALGGRKVDIATPEILRNPFRRESIVADLKPIYEA